MKFLCENKGRRYLSCVMEKRKNLGRSNFGVIFMHNNRGFIRNLDSVKDETIQMVFEVWLQFCFDWGEGRFEFPLEALFRVFVTFFSDIDCKERIC